MTIEGLETYILTPRDPGVPAAASYRRLEKSSQGAIQQNHPQNPLEKMKTHQKLPDKKIPSTLRQLKRDLVQSLNLGPIWQASDSLSPRAPGSARRPFLKFAPEPPELGRLFSTCRPTTHFNNALLSGSNKWYECCRWRFNVCESSPIRTE